MQFQNLKNFRLPDGFRGKPAWYVQTWWLVQMLFFKTSPQCMYGWRRFLLRRFGAKIGKKVMIRPTAHIQFPWKLQVGDYSWIGDEVVLYNLGEISIGSHAVVSQRSYLCTGGHRHNKTEFSIYAEPIAIHDQCWLAADVFVGPGVHIGAGTVIGSRSSVFKSLPAAKICFGTPAVVVKDRVSLQDELKITFHQLPALRSIILQVGYNQAF
ncbi:putative colanic acid biosynthesis acetyltransferase [Parafilimonas sp.]|uniref:putative colanic acid biosynthesis acetyltransferase n=1 Tax=Parafilimonas sp. TaxID=1969739 RepID=UPI0039E3E53D